MKRPRALRLTMRGAAPKSDVREGSTRQTSGRPREYLLTKQPKSSTEGRGAERVRPEGSSNCALCAAAVHIRRRRVPSGGTDSVHGHTQRLRTARARTHTGGDSMAGRAHHGQVTVSVRPALVLFSAHVRQGRSLPLHSPRCPGPARGRDPRQASGATHVALRLASVFRAVERFIRRTRESGAQNCAALQTKRWISHLSPITRPPLLQVGLVCMGMVCLVAEPA